MAFSRIFDGQQGLQHSVLEDCGVKKSCGIFCWRSFWAEFELVPASGEVHSELMFGFGFDGGGGFGNGGGLPNFFQECRWFPAVEVVDESVVGEDLNLVVREQDGEEEVAVVGALSPSGHCGGGGASVVSVCDVSVWHGCELRFDELGVFRVLDDPSAVADAVAACKVDCGNGFGNFLKERVQFGVRGIDQKDRPGLGVKGFYVADSVFLFFRAG